MSRTEEFAYDQLPYPSFTFPQTGPNRLATMAVYHGIGAADPANCRTLELGCGNGANLMSFAHVLKGSEFVGIDLSQVHIDDARDSAKALEIHNVEFEKFDIADITAERFGKFDFIVAHGVFSWVPDNIRDQLLRVYSECLNPNGIGYISYNTYPGFYFRQILRDMMRMHSEEATSPDEMVRRGIELLQVIGNSIETGPYQQILTAESSKMGSRWVSNIYHDEFAEINKAYYFRDFAKMLGENGLQYLSECTLEKDIKIDQETLELLGAAPDDPIKYQQYIDFVICRRFRSSLVCKDSQNVNRKPKPDVMRNFCIFSRLRSEDIGQDLANENPAKFATAKGATVEVNHPLTKAALVHLESIWAHSENFDDLIATASRMIGRKEQPEQEDVELTAAYLMKMFENELISASRFKAEFPVEVSERPVASPFARWQILRASDSVTTLTGMNIELEYDLMKHLVLLLDGTRGRVELFTDVVQSAEVPEENRQEYLRALPGLIDAALESLAKCGLLVA